MDSSSAIIVAVITAVGGILVAFVNRGRKENKDDHNEVMKRLDGLTGEVSTLSKITVGHLKWHQRQPKPKRKTKK